MSLPDGAEYWWKERSMPYMGKEFKHHPNKLCSHYNIASGNVNTTPYVEDINCYACKASIESGAFGKEGLIKGKAPEDFYLSKRGKKEYRKRKSFIEKYGQCSCGSDWTIRKNTKSQLEFLGCCNYPKCKNTKAYINLIPTLKK